MEAGALVWIRDTISNNAWLPGIILNKECDGSDFIVSVTGDDDSSAVIARIRLKSENEENLDLKLRNLQSESQVENLIKLPYLNEPAILHCLQERYNTNHIYTYTGPILIAVNPFRKVELYTTRLLEEYYNHGLMKSHGVDIEKDLSPHVYAIADNAYRQMMLSMHGHLSEKKTTGVTCNQSILISGESGAGKTESTKVVLSYLTTVGGNVGKEDVQGSIMQKVLQSNPILEAFGNAKTKRNDNSSRFGKFIDLNFSKRGTLIGGSIRTYLLEKVRLPLQQTGERNFHIFYQLVAGCTEMEKQRRGLLTVEQFNYTSKSGVYVLTGINDLEQYNELRRALNTLHFDISDQERMFDIVSGVLHLGQLLFDSTIDGEGEGSILSTLEVSTKSLETVSMLLGLSSAKIIECLTVRAIVAAGETYHKKLTKVQAADARDAFAKTIYGKLFEWIVRLINSRIECDVSNIKANIGVLDIFGFESFAINSFEQLCINYANEALQQQFNQFIFKLEQQEYEKEKIEWSFIQFPDNKDCLELIEHKVHGLFAMLDDECRLPKASDEKFAARIYKEYQNHGRFTASAAQKRAVKFSINHYAGSVEYSVATFVEKNKDELPKESSTLLSASSNPLMQMLFRDNVDLHDPMVGIDLLSPAQQLQRKRSLGPRTMSNISTMYTVGTQFKEQLNNLMTTIYSTAPHYIRCLKPNDQNVSDNFNRFRITEQLRYGGVLEAVRVARSGFPVRLVHSEFYMRYKMLSPSFDMKSISPKEFCLKFVDIIEKKLLSATKSRVDTYTYGFNSPISSSGFQLGLTKFFLRKENHDFLETCRFRCMTYCAVKSQSFIRCHTKRFKYKLMKVVTALIQRVYRGYRSRLLADSLRRQKASILIQSHARRYLAKSRYQFFIFGLTSIQSNWRRKIFQRKYKQVLRQKAAIVLQKNLLMHRDRSRLHKFRRVLISLQSLFRRYKAKLVLKALKIEAKDLGKLQENNETLKKEIEMLKAKALEEREKLHNEFEKQNQSNLLHNKDLELDTLKSQILELKMLVESERRERLDLEKTVALHRNLDTSTNSVCQFCRQKLTSDSSERSPSTPVSEHATNRKSQHKSSKSLAPVSLPPEILVAPAPSINGKESAGVSQPDTNLHAHTQAQDIVLAEVGRLRQINVEQQLAIESLRRELKSRDDKEIDTRKASTDQVLISSHPKKRNSVRKSTEKISAVLPPSIIPDTVSKEVWGAVWDEEGSNDGSESLAEANGSSGKGSTERSNAASPSSESIALLNLEKNVEKWKSELIKGVRAWMWEGLKVSNTEIILKLDLTGTVFQFIHVQQRRAFVLFNSKVDIASVKLAEVVECTPGADIKADQDNHSLFITMSSLGGEDFPSRLIALKFSTRDDRNMMLSKLRALVSAAAINTGWNTKLNQQMKNQVLVNGHVNRGEHSTVSPIAQRSVRRLSMREAVIEKNLSNTVAKPDHLSLSSKGADDSALVRELALKLKEEKDSQTKLKIQMALMNNEIVERDEQITLLRKKEAEYDNFLRERDNIAKQDAIVRLQLGKRLEQVLMDKEEALEQLEQLRAQLDNIARVNYEK